jgi:hypothetical protein
MDAYCGRARRASLDVIFPATAFARSTGLRGFRKLGAQAIGPTSEQDRRKRSRRRPANIGADAALFNFDCGPYLKGCLLGPTAD